MSTSAPTLPALATLDWGRTGYADAWARQEALVARRNAGEAGDTLVFTEHDPVYTLGVRKGAEQHLIWDEERLLQDGQVYRRTELWDPAQAANGWQKIATPGGTESPPDSIERVLRIEPDDKDPSLTRFGCVLQGTVTPEMLKALRPDIGGKAPGAK